MPREEQPDNSRSVNRWLGPLALFMVTINGTLGVGLYWRGGDIVEMGGPLAVVLAFLIMGFIAWTVMQCITELLCIWPVPGAMAIYVSEFVDNELGIAVGIAYWFTYSVSFAALLATTAAEVTYWNNSKGIQGAIMFVVVPLILVLINALGVEVYGLVEVVVGSMKISVFVVIIIAMIAINAGAGNDPVADGGHIGARFWNSPTPYETQAASDWFIAFLMTLSVAGFAYVGVEIIAASALEARWPTSRRSDDEEPNNVGGHDAERQSAMLIGETIRFAAVWIPVFAMIAYTVGGILVASNIEHDDCLLTRQSWIKKVDSDGKLLCAENGIPFKANRPSMAPFVAIAKRSQLPSLASAINIFLIFTAITCANTNLYVASRTFFGLASRLRGGEGAPPWKRILAWFGKTNNRNVPMRAMIFSAVAFWWVPLISLAPGGSDSSSPIGMFIEALSQMGTDGVIIVWACECWAFLRFYYCVKRHAPTLEEKRFPQVRRFQRIDDDYPFRSHGQPVTGFFALFACLLVLIVANGAFLWRGFQRVPFVSAYLTIIVFVLIVALLKLTKGAKWALVDLSQCAEVEEIFRRLNEIRHRGAADVEPEKSLWNLWGHI